VSSGTCMTPHFVGSLFKRSTFIFIGYYPMPKDLAIIIIIIIIIIKLYRCIFFCFYFMPV
jgi:hypothetical protein